MQFEQRMDYRGSVDEVVAMLCDDGFHAQLAETMHALRHELTVTTGDDGTTHVQVTRVMPAEVPDFIKPLVGSEIHVVQDEDWAPADGAGTAGGAGTRSADLAITSPRKPVGFAGTMTLAPTDDGCTQHVIGKINVRLPIGGHKVAEQVERALRYGMEAQERVGNEWLSTSDGQTA
ncbi:MAG TPA: DUF2505 domain-containing protein [Nitriliruptoraceae bacterium]|nr:DUF2505 domain-containing protein [Nitriliruptoraceae bacterium]